MRGNVIRIRGEKTKNRLSLLANSNTAFKS